MVRRLPIVWVMLVLVAHDTALRAESPDPMVVDLDASDIARRILSSTVTVPLDAQTRLNGGEVPLWYPKWVPGSHAPGGPIGNVAGLIVHDERGRQLQWQRTPGEIYRFLVTVPPGARQLHVNLRYITNQPTTNSFGLDSFGSALLGVISPNTLLVYREGIDIDTLHVQSSVRLPPKWQAATALAARAGDSPSLIHFEPVSLRMFVDSPIMCGRYYKAYDLVPDEDQAIPPHRLHVFSEAESVLNVPADTLARLRQMVTQSARLFGSHPFDQFDILLATTDLLPANGLEHSHSSFNVLHQRALQSKSELRGWNRLLIPHEYIHAWCGKFRTPKGMLTSDFHTPVSTDTLWVYEGLTQYLGELIEARCGLMNEEEFLHRLAVEVRHAMLQQGRQWRSLADTGAASSVLRDHSPSWPGLRRSQDYYMEGMLFWLEIDAMLREATDGKATLDHFCRKFFAASSPTTVPSPYVTEDIVDSLNQLAPYDWRGLIARRVESVGQPFQTEFLRKLGYLVQYSNERPDIPDDTYRAVPQVDAYDSLGMSVSHDGVVRDILLDSPAHVAGLGPGMKIISVNGNTWSSNRLLDAIAMSVTRQRLDLLVASGDTVKPYRLAYDGGPRYLVLKKTSDGEVMLSRILKPL